MKWLLYFVPGGLFVFVVFLFVRDIGGTASGSIAPLHEDRSVPQTTLSPLEGAQAFTSRDLKAGHVTVLNVWASWCVPCRAEAPALAALSRLKGIPLYGIVYEDRATDARQYLRESGNPYNRIDMDRSGVSSRMWGVGGVPETFVIDGNGIVRLHYSGPLVGDALKKIVFPAVVRARNAG